MKLKACSCSCSCFWLPPSMRPQPIWPTKVAGAKEAKKKWKPTHGRQSWRRLCPRWQSLHLEGNIFHTLQQLGVLSFRVSPPFKKKRKPVPQLVPHFAMFAQAGDKLLGVRFVTTKALFIIEPFGTHTHRVGHVGQICLNSCFNSYQERGTKEGENSTKIAVKALFWRSVDSACILCSSFSKNISPGKKWLC